MLTLPGALIGVNVVDMTLVPLGRESPGYRQVQPVLTAYKIASVIRRARIARDAYRDFGKGSGHKAGLNFGDCFAYALSKSTGEALLFKGNDFSHTDITPALPAALEDNSG
jgi:uncharacterized protein with PIN domain